MAIHDRTLQGPGITTGVLVSEAHDSLEERSSYRRSGVRGGLGSRAGGGAPGCEGEARWFYGELLGLVALEKPASLRNREGVWFAVGDQQLHVGVYQPFEPARKAHPALRVRPDTIDELSGRLAAAGSRVGWDGEIEGVRRFFSEDPWGNRIELLATRSS